MAKAFAGKNARGFHNLPIGTHISICYPYNPITHEIDEEEVLFVEVGDIAKAQFKQMTLYPTKNTKLITFTKAISMQKSAYETSVAVTKHQERVQLAKEHYG